jgi:lipoate-protein ligase A
MKPTKKYNLPDISLLYYDKDEYGKYKVWVPDRQMVVIGRGSDADKEVNFKLTENDNIEVIRRDSGGCAVFLSPNMVVTSFALYGQKLINPMSYFRMFNEFVINALTRLGLDNVEVKGISDLSVNGKKISGSSIYRNKDLVLFHIVINLCEDVGLIGKYLLHPPREPKYREGRRHKDFVTSIHSLGVRFSIEDFEKEVSEEWNKHLLSIKKDKSNP